MPIMSNRYYFLLSVLAVLALRCSSASYVSVVDASHLVKRQNAPVTCATHDQPNPIAKTYPNNATGTLNGTVMVVPIPLSSARELIPKQYGILEHAYRDLLPHFPKDMYPVLVQALHDHDVKAMGFSIQDFTRAGVEFPFVDLLGDNTTSFKWIPSLLITATHQVALSGATSYGEKVYPSTSHPACDAYQSVPSAAPGTTSSSATSVIPNDAFVHVDVAPTQTSPYPPWYFQNVTNQVMFADGKTCDNMIRLFNTSLSAAPYGIDAVQGTVRAKAFPFTAAQHWQGVYGLRFDSAFVENNYLPCESFKGYGQRYT